MTTLKLITETSNKTTTKYIIVCRNPKTNQISEGKIAWHLGMAHHLLKRAKLLYPSNEYHLKPVKVEVRNAGPD